MGLTVNQGAIGEYFNAMQLASGSDSMDQHVRYLFCHSDTEELAYAMVSSYPITMTTLPGPHCW